MVEVRLRFNPTPLAMDEVSGHNDATSTDFCGAYSAIIIVVLIALGSFYVGCQFGVNAPQQKLLALQVQREEREMARRKFAPAGYSNPEEMDKGNAATTK